MRIKEILTVRGIEFQSVNILEDNGLAVLQALGARSVPVVSRGDKFVFAQVIKDVVDFLGLNEDVGPKLSPAQLAFRYAGIMEKAIKLVRQMPDTQLQRELPNRPRSWRVLLHHVFQIPSAYLDMEETGETLSYENMVAPPPENLITSEAIAAFGESVHSRWQSWWQSSADANFNAQVPTYFGKTSRHEMLERTVWHSTQHVRQVASLLQQSGIDPVDPIVPEDWDGLPLTDVVWDEG